MTGSALALWCACVAAEGVALVMAVRRWGCSSPAPMSVARPNPSHEHDSNLRPIVALLAFAVAEDVAVRLLNDLVIAPSSRPLHGLARGAYHVADALVMGWPLGLAWATWRLFAATSSGFSASSERLKSEGLDPQKAKTAQPLAWASWRVFVGAQKQNGPDRSEPFGFLFRRSRCGSLTLRPLAGPVKPLDVLGAVYVGFLVALVGLHPLGAANTSWVLLAWEVVALGFAVAAIVRGWRGAVRGEAAWTVAHGVLLVLVPVEASVCAIGPFARPDVFSAWHVARWQYLAAFAIVGGMLGVRRRPDRA